MAKTTKRMKIVNARQADKKLYSKSARTPKKSISTKRNGKAKI